MIFTAGVIVIISIVCFMYKKRIKRMILTIFSLYAKWLIHDFEKFYGNIQENTIRNNNTILNNLLIKYKENPTENAKNEVLKILQENKSWIILTFMDNNDPNDNRTIASMNSINFRTLKHNSIEVFTDFNIMKSHFGNFITTELMKIHDFIELCYERKIKNIVLNSTFEIDETSFKNLLTIIYNKKFMFDLMKKIADFLFEDGYKPVVSEEYNSIDFEFENKGTVRIQFYKEDPYFIQLGYFIYNFKPEQKHDAVDIANHVNRFMKYAFIIVHNTQIIAHSNIMIEENMNIKNVLYRNIPALFCAFDEFQKYINCTSINPN